MQKQLVALGWLFLGFILLVLMFNPPTHLSANLILLCGAIIGWFGGILFREMFID